ncbi:MAG: hypothetical protein IH957_01545 [Chloroflexi bacterium]|nr:hypothetical protein [Chloroflexota bacterium]
MTNLVVRAAVWLMDLRRGEHGQSLGSFTMILMFGLAAAAMAFALMSSGMLESSGGSGAQGIQGPNFEPPNPFD